MNCVHGLIWILRTISDLSLGRILDASICVIYPRSRPHRLTVRTPGFHPGNRGSIPLEVTMKQDHPVGGLFSCHHGRSEPRTTKSCVRRSKPRAETCFEHGCRAQAFRLIPLEPSIDYQLHTYTNPLTCIKIN